MRQGRSLYSRLSLYANCIATSYLRLTSLLVVSTPLQKRKAAGHSQPSLSTGNSSLQLVGTLTQHSQPDAPSLLDISHTSHEAAAAEELFDLDSQELQSQNSSIKIETLSLPPIEPEGQQEPAREASADIEALPASIKREASVHPLMEAVSDSQILEALVGLDHHSQIDIEVLFDAVHNSAPSESQSQSQSTQIIGTFDEWRSIRLECVLSDIVSQST